MRTTITLDDDLADALKQLAHDRRRPFKSVVNDAIRAGLAGDEPAPKPFHTEGRALGLRPGFNLHKASLLADELEDEELVTKSLRGR
jgi:hypothetical protein